MPKTRPNPEVVEAARKACATTREWATLAVQAAEPLIRQQVIEERDRYKADLDSLRSQLREEYERAESKANSFSVAPPGEVNSRLMLAHRGYADRLSKLLSEEGR